MTCTKWAEKIQKEEGKDTGVILVICKETEKGCYKLEMFSANVDISSMLRTARRLTDEAISLVDEVSEREMNP